MRTNNLLIGAVAMMAFAACQNEEWVNENQNSLDRAQVEVTLNADKAGLDASTRLGADLKFEIGDELGVCLVDPAGTLADDKHIGNAKFVRQESGEFTSPSTISVGKQLFYYKYDEKNTTTRAGVIVENLGVQTYDATTAEMAKKDFFVSPVVDLSGYEAGAISLPVTMYSIYGYGDIKIKNSTEEDFQIQKVVITSGEEFVLGGTLQPNTVTTKNKDLIVDLTKKDITEAEIKAAFDKANKVYVDGDKRTYINWVADGGKSENKGSVAINFLTGTTGVTVKAGEETSTRVLIPAGQYVANNFKVTVYTNKGKQEFAGSTTGVVEMRDNKVEIYNSRKKTITADVKSLTPETDGITVISTDDMIASLQQFAGSDAKEVKVTPTTALTIDNTVLAGIPSNVTLNFAGGSDITFTPGATAAMDLKKVKFEKNSAKASIVTLKDGKFNVSDFTLGDANNLILDDKADVTFGKNVAGGGSSNTYIKTGATLNVAATFISYYNVAGGTLNVGSAAATKATPAPIAIYWKDVTVGEININVPVNNSNAFTVGNVSVKPETPETDITLNINADMTGNAITINYDAKVVNKSTSAIATNNGEIDHKSGVLTVATNNSTINNNVDAVKTSGKLVVTTNAAAGIINTIADSQTDVETNSGYIYYTEGAFINGTGSGANAEAGNVVFTISEDMNIATLTSKFANTPCTALFVDGATLTIEDKADMTALSPLQAITLKGANVTVNANVEFKKCPLFVYGHCKMTGTKAITYGGNNEDIITVKENAIFETGVAISGLNKVTIEKDGKVVARATVSGKGAVDGEGAANWIGTAYTKNK